MTEAKERKVNNNVCLVGTVEKEFYVDHELYGEKFYKTRLVVERQSGTVDYVPIMVSERIVENFPHAGTIVKICGMFRSYNLDGHLVLSVFVKEMFVVDYIEHNNNVISLEGFICKKPIYRQTALGREIADILFAVNRTFGKSDYIPCIAWGRNARWADYFEVGEHLKIKGRIQSRDYFKVVEGQEIVKTAYEVSIQEISKVEE